MVYLEFGFLFSPSLVKIHSATVRVVAGTIHQISADLKDKNGKSKICNIEILSQPWMDNGIAVTFACAGEQVITKRHNA